MELLGLHHTSSLTARLRDNIAFYTQVLGLRRVLTTVNQDNPSMYHLLYGDAAGQPGALLTFFDLPHAARHRPGRDAISEIGLGVASREALGWWQERLDTHRISHTGIAELGTRATLGFTDPEGQRLRLVAPAAHEHPATGSPWPKSPVPIAFGLRGLASALLTVRDLEPTARVLRDLFGLRELDGYARPDAATQQVLVFALGSGAASAQLHVEERPEQERARYGAGGVHHLAFRVAVAELEGWHERLMAAGLRSTGVVDRHYFQSLYVREPNGILFELASDGPPLMPEGSPEKAGEILHLPPWLEPRRVQIEAALAPLP
jgi:glyoxalase family protein